MQLEGYLGLDLGGTGAKAGVFDRNGRPLAVSHRSYATEISPDGRSELNIEDIEEASCQAVQEVTALSQARILALSVSSQGQTFVTLDGADQPLHKVIAWYDSRATEEASEIRGKLDAASREGLDISPIASVSKILWLRKNQPAVMGRAARFLLLPDYITYRLTGQAVYDPVMAYTTGLYAEAKCRYSRRATGIAGIKAGQLSEVAPAGAPVGKVRPDIAGRWGLQSETRVAVGTNDQLAGALGAGNAAPGVVTETTGTCLALITLTHPPLPPLPAGLFQGPFPVAGTKYLLAYSKTAGLVLEWFRAQLGDNESCPDLDRKAGTIPSGSQGLLVLPHFDGVISPRPNEAARGAFVDLSLQHTRAHIYRAILEAVAYSLRENLELLEANGFRAEQLRSIGGGAKSPLWLQIKADVLGRPLEQPLVTEAAVLGAAMLAATSTGDFATVREASEGMYKVGRVFESRDGEHSLYEPCYRRYLQCQSALYPSG